MTRNLITTMLSPPPVTPGDAVPNRSYHTRATSIVSDYHGASFLSTQGALAGPSLVLCAETPFDADLAHGAPVAGIADGFALTGISAHGAVIGGIPVAEIEFAHGALVPS